MSIPQEVLNHFKTYPIGKVHPMAAFRTAVSLLGLYDEKSEDMSDEANYEKAIKPSSENCYNCNCIRSNP